MTEDKSIVLDLAKRGPFIRHEDDHPVCADCGAIPFCLTPPIYANHEPSCLWRRAKERYP